MPTPVSAKILGMLRTRLFNNFFPTDYAGLQKSPDNSSASLLKHLSEADYLRVRGELAGQLMDKEPAKAILIAAGVPEQAASDFAARNIEVNRLPINHGVRAMRERKVEVAVDEAIEKTGGLTVRRPGLERGDNVRLHTTFAAMMLRPKPGMGLADEVASMFKGIFTKRKGWGGAVMETANGNGNGNGNGHYATMPPPRPGVKGKGLAATPATQPTDAASTLHAS
jgi:hypothetical protein